MEDGVPTWSPLYTLQLYRYIVKWLRGINANNRMKGRDRKIQEFVAHMDINLKIVFFPPSYLYWTCEENLINVSTGMFNTSCGSLSTVICCGVFLSLCGASMWAVRQVRIKSSTQSLHNKAALCWHRSGKGGEESESESDSKPPISALRPPIYPRTSLPFFCLAIYLWHGSVRALSESL